VANVLDIIIRAVDQASGPAKGIVGAMGGIATAAAAAGAAVAAASVAIGVASVKVAADFEQSLANTAAATGATTEQLAGLRKEALAIGSATSKSATESAEAMGELVKAGLSIETVIDGAARAVVQLAEATGSDVTDMAILVSNSLNTFQKDGLKAAQVADIVAKAANASAIGTSEISFALAAVGPVAAQAGLTMQDFATAVGILGNNALKGSDAGTSLKTMLMRLTAPTDTAASVLDELGVKVFDAAGKTRGFRDILGDLQGSLAGASEQQKAATLTTLFGSDAIRAANILLGAGVEGWDEFNKTMGEAPSVAEQSAIRLNTLNGAIEQAKGALETIGIEIGTAFLPALTGIARAVGGGLDFQLEADWSKLSNAFGAISEDAGMVLDALLPVFGGGASAIGPSIVSTVNNAAEALKRLSNEVSMTFIEKVVPIIETAVETVQKILGGEGVEAFTEFLDPVEDGIGDKLATLYQKYYEWLGGTLKVVVEQLGKWAGAFLDWVAPFIPPLMKQLGIFMDKMLFWFAETALPAIYKQLGEWGAAFVDWIGPRIPGIMLELGKMSAAVIAWMLLRVPELQVALGKWALTFLGWVATDVIPQLPGVLGGIITAIVKFIDGAMEPVRQAGTQFGTAIRKGFVQGIRSMSLPIPTVDVSIGTNALGLSIPSINIGSRSISLGDYIPALAAGGIVTKPTLALIGEAGPEAVVPLSRGGGYGGQTVVVNINAPVYGVRHFKELVFEAMVEAQRRGRASGIVAQT
jgi:TP901 family phage tail tape measure protein